MITARPAAILAAGLVAAVGLYLYFSPYQQCVRSLGAQSHYADSPQVVCLAAQARR